MKIREEIYKGIKIRVGNGLHTHIWFDNWHREDPLIKKYSGRAIYDSSLVCYAKVSSIIVDGKIEMALF